MEPSSDHNILSNSRLSGSVHKTGVSSHPGPVSRLLRHQQHGRTCRHPGDVRACVTNHSRAVIEAGPMAAGGGGWSETNVFSGCGGSRVCVHDRSADNRSPALNWFLFPPSPPLSSDTGVQCPADERCKV